MPLDIWLDPKLNLQLANFVEILLWVMASFRASLGEIFAVSEARLCWLIRILAEGVMGDEPQSFCATFYENI